MKSVILLLVAIALTAADSPAFERVIAGDGIVAATIDGTALSMRIDPGATGWPIVTTSVAETAGLTGGPIGFGYAIGPERITGRTAITRLDLGGGSAKRRIGWTERPYTAAAQGVIGPAGVPDDVVRFVLRPATASDHTVALPMVDAGGLFGGLGGLFAQIEVGGAPLRVRFDPWHRRSLASAGAAARLARAQGAVLAGATEKVEIAFGIERPVRTMTLATPMIVGPLSLSTIGVRTADFGTIAGIPDADQAVDPDEVVVTATKKRSPDRDRISLGADQLTRCSSIVFDKPAKQIRLTCS